MRRAKFPPNRGMIDFWAELSAKSQIFQESFWMKNTFFSGPKINAYYLDIVNVKALWKVWRLVQMQDCYYYYSIIIEAAVLLFIICCVISPQILSSFIKTFCSLFLKFIFTVHLRVSMCPAKVTKCDVNIIDFVIEMNNIAKHYVFIIIIYIFAVYLLVLNS